LFAKSRQLKPLPNFGVQSNNQKLKKFIDSSTSFLYLSPDSSCLNSPEKRQNLYAQEGFTQAKIKEWRREFI
jgi:hypothetical protein